MLKSNITIAATDGFKLAATVYSVEQPQAWVVVNSATGVPRGFYDRFANYLTERNWNVVTYDYRGIGESRPESLVGFEAHVSDWGLKDMQGVLNWVLDAHKPDKLYFVGHSAGGQQSGLLEHSDAITAMATLSAQSGYWRVQGGSEKIKVLLIAWLLMPVITRLFGYFPWSRLASGEDLPKYVALGWAQWCRSHQYLLGDNNLPLERFQTFQCPVLAYSVADDNWGTAIAVDRMMSAYPNVQRRHLVPKAHQLKGLGHMGYFKKASSVLWPELADWLAQY